MLCCTSFIISSTGDIPQDSVAEWAYQSGVQAQALAWREKSNTEAVEADCLALF